MLQSMKYAGILRIVPIIPLFQQIGNSMKGCIPGIRGQMAMRERTRRIRAKYTELHS